MTWNSWYEPDNEFDLDGLTAFEKAQVQALQDVVRQYEVETRRYRDLLYWLATRIEPGEVDRRQIKNPFAFSRMAPEDWRVFFERALRHRIFSSDPAILEPSLREEAGSLKQRIVELKAQVAELKRERDQLQTATNALRGEAASFEQAGETEPVAEAFSEGADLIPETYPEQYAVLFSTETPRKWRREVVYLAILAGKGYSAEVGMRQAIVQFAQRNATSEEKKRDRVLRSADAGSIKRLIRRLAERRLIKRLPVKIGQNTIIITMLTDLGKEVAQAMGIPPVESEWERLMRLHGGERQQKHAAQVCLFTHHARLRGWRTQVCPEVQPPADPDVLIEREGQRIYVEVEAGSGSVERRMKKWRNQRQLQGFVALCAPTERVRKMLLQEAAASGKVLATDFVWLRETAPDRGLWSVKW